MTFKQLTQLLPNWLQSLIAALIIAVLVYLSTNQTWGWHDGVAFVSGYIVTWWTTYAEKEKQNPNPTESNEVVK